ncbi:hypothetical protein ACRCUN_24245 [Mycobacterium sp. LTG2003]
MSYAVVTAIVMVVAMIVALQPPPPYERATLRLASPLPPGDRYEAINTVTHWPSDWIAAVCVPPLYDLRIPYEELPYATAGAACEARVQPDGEVVNITIARFPSELAMQVDLVNAGFEWYAFAFDRGQMVAFATFSEAMVTDPMTNLGESPVLQPLKHFGFEIYSSPGP